LHCFGLVASNYHRGNERSGVPVLMFHFYCPTSQIAVVMYKKEGTLVTCTGKRFHKLYTRMAAISQGKTKHSHKNRG